MISLCLVIMAAGMGSRYGGLKQIDPVGPLGEIIMDYSIYDAINAGFSKVVFIIKEELKEDFYDSIGRRVGKVIETDYVFQKIDNVPAGFQVPPERKKPWGTAHAVLSCKDKVTTPFLVINADDFYGAETFKMMADYLSCTNERSECCNFALSGFHIEKTLTDHGHVARALCEIDSAGFLKSIKEITQIYKSGNSAKYSPDGINYTDIPAGSIVSMNGWGFTPDIFPELERKFPEFLEQSKDNILKVEFYIPSVVDDLIAEKKANVKVLTTDERWYGVTYREDKPGVMEAINKMIAKGIYPEKLWG